MASLAEAGVPTRYLEVEGRDHFDVAEALMEPQYALSLAIAELLRSCSSNCMEPTAGAIGDRARVLLLGGLGAVVVA